MGDYFYPRSPCGERLHYDNYNLHCVEISIHALLAESDGPAKTAKADRKDFYPRSPCGERLVDTLKFSCPMLFLSTLSLRRATFSTGSCSVCSSNFYPRSPCGERQHHRNKLSRNRNFYPRSPCGERRKTHKLNKPY